jgi:hypothetical protein
MKESTFFHYPNNHTEEVPIEKEAEADGIADKELEILFSYLDIR